MNTILDDLRKQIEMLAAQYRINSNGYITTPGKFLGERIGTVYFHEQFLNGLQDDCAYDYDLDAYFFFAGVEEISLLNPFGPDTHYKVFQLTFTNDGFVIGGWITIEEAEQLINGND